MQVSVWTPCYCVPLTSTMVAGPVPPSSGHSRPTSVMPPSPRYWPTATSEHSNHQYSFGDIVAFIQILLEYNRSYRSWWMSSSLTEDEDGYPAQRHGDEVDNQEGAAAGGDIQSQLSRITFRQYFCHCINGQQRIFIIL